MKDYIKYSGENLSAASSQLGRLSHTLSDVADMLSAVNTSADWWSKVGLWTNYGGARETLQAGKKNMTAIRKTTENTISGINRTRAIFDDTERRAAQGAEGGEYSKYRESNGIVGQVSATVAVVKTTQKETKSKFWEFLTKAIGGSSGIGKFIEGIYTAATAGDWTKGAQGVTKMIQGLHKTFASDAPAWKESLEAWKKSRGVVEQVGKAVATTAEETAAKWSLKTFAQTFGEKFDSSIGKASTWAFSAIISGFETIKDAKDHRYKEPEDYAVKWITRTGTDVFLKSTVGAAVTAAFATAGIALGGWAPLVVGVTTAVVIYAGDSLVAWASDGKYKGISDAISDVAVKIRSFERNAIRKTADAISTKWNSFVGNLLPSFG